MSHRATARAFALVAVLAAGLVSPALGRASSGGSGLAGPPTGSSSAPAAHNAPQSANQVVSASSAGMSISTRASAVLRGQLRVAGRVAPSLAGSTIEIDRLGRQTGEQWAPTATATVADDGSFAAVWHVNHIGRFALRAIISGHESHAAGASPTVMTTIFRPSLATFYGPGFFGHRTACGQVLSHRTLGVANRTLPCGTPVALLYRGRTLIVPVIDRGPYSNGADWDLTSATAAALGMTGTETIGAVSLPRGS